MNTIDIEWIEIPKGDFAFGLSDMQVHEIRARLWSECGLSPGHRDFERVSRIVNRLSQNAKAKIAPEEKEVWREPRYRLLFFAEAVLRNQIRGSVIQLESFLISRFPITNEQLGVFLAEPIAKSLRPAFENNFRTADEAKHPNLPAIVHWQLADFFCQWIGGRLPKTAEWEKAARGNDGRLYPWGNFWEPDRCNCTPLAGTSATGVDVTPINKFPGGVSPYGVWDMAGNVAEWTSTLVLSNNGVQGPARKSHSFAKAIIPWFEQIAAIQYPGGNGPKDSYYYTGYRVVRDAWLTRYWQGWKV
jgi:formylglycine-generating enzyme required for sulfatase activity